VENEELTVREVMALYFSADMLKAFKGRGFHDSPEYNDTDLCS
jgi:hypothetical protein